jgi:acetate kinase
MYADRVRTAVGALAVNMGGLDALVFTAGVGENSPGIRAAVCARLAFLGIDLDRESNERTQLDADIATTTSAVRVLVIHAREDLVVARAVREVIAS